MHHKAEIISNWFFKCGKEFTVFTWPPQSSDVNTVELGEIALVSFYANWI